MTPRSGPLSENGKVIAICLLFPIFWPFLPVILICMGVDKIRRSLDGPLWRFSCWRRGMCPKCNWPKAECVCRHIDR